MTASSRGEPIFNASASNSCSHYGRLVAHGIASRGGLLMKQGYRLIIVDKAGVLVSEFQLTENALDQPEAFVSALKQSIEDIEEEES